MIDKNIIAARISEIKEGTKLLQPLTIISSEEFAKNPDYFLKAERLLEIIVQSIIDIGTHIIAAKSFKKAEDYHQVVDILVKEGVFQENLSDRLHELIGLRNLLAHEYLEIDRDRFHQDIKTGFSDFEIICKSIINYLEK